MPFPQSVCDVNAVHEMPVSVAGPRAPELSRNRILCNSVTCFILSICHVDLPLFPFILAYIWTYNKNTFCHVKQLSNKISRLNLCKPLSLGGGMKAEMAAGVNSVHRIRDSRQLHANKA
jgi:hypothetical protein